MANTSIDDLATEIRRELQLYSEDIVEKIDISSERVGREAVKRLKETSPKDKGNYAKSWTMTTEKPRFLGPANRIIHVKKPHYRLTHLLEHGHAKVGGGRTRKFIHIEPAEDLVVQEFMNEVEEAIKQRG